MFAEAALKRGVEASRMTLTRDEKRVRARAVASKRKRKEDSEEKSISSFFQGFPCRILAKSGPGITSFESTTNKGWSLRRSRGLG